MKSNNTSSSKVGRRDSVIGQFAKLEGYQPSKAQKEKDVKV